MESPPLLKQIEAAGAEAYRAGCSYLSNPYYASVNCPGATGEPLAEWNRKVAAWEDGWEREAARFASESAAAGSARGGRRAAPWDTAPARR
jgi:hypothetical protein